MFNSTANPVSGVPGSFDEPLASSNEAMMDDYQSVPHPRMLRPMVTGGAVVGIKFEGGVMIAADTLVSYGNHTRFHDVERVFKVNERIVIGGGADFADFQYIQRRIDSKIMEDRLYSSKTTMGPRSLYTWLRHIIYRRRCQFRPLLAEILIAGLNEDNTFFLGTIDSIGTAYESDIVSTCCQSLVVPLMRQTTPKDRMCTKEEATAMIHTSLQMLFYRYCRSISSYMVAVCTKDSCEVIGPKEVSQNWLISYLVEGY